MAWSRKKLRRKLKRHMKQFTWDMRGNLIRRNGVSHAP